jgi:BirA family biotin operon repressor/biotin-[acetyl-CoA-carboxylase] ligase
VNTTLQHTPVLFNMQKLKSVCDFSYTEETGSTNQDALNAAKNGAKDFSCFFAETQTFGRGRRGRTWQTFPFVSIACSVVVQKGGSDMLPLLTSLALSKGIEQHTGIKTDIKWPNDLQINGNKVAGILVESFVQEGTYTYIVGIGLNVNTPAGGVTAPVTTLEEAQGQKIDREELLATILEVFKHSLDVFSTEGWQAFQKEYEDKCITLGSNVIWHSDAGKISGKAERMEEDGTLCIKSEGKEYKVRAGDVIAEGGAA